MLRQVSVLPRCNHVAAILDARTLAEGLQSLALAALDALTAIFAESFLSLGAVVAMVILCWCMASSGGYGAVPSGPPPPPPGNTMSFWDKMALKYVFNWKSPMLMVTQEQCVSAVAVPWCCRLGLLEMMHLESSVYLPLHRHGAL